MEFDRTGFILYVINYQACVDFYKNMLELKVMFSTENLTCFKFGESYLMVELDDENPNETNSIRTKTCLRMNVKNVKALADKLIQQQIKVNYKEHAWGIIAKFYDPDGNLLAFKDSEKFEKQIIKSKN